MSDSPPDDEDDCPPYPAFDSEELGECVDVRLVPKGTPNPALLAELAVLFADAARQAGGVPPAPLDPVPDDQGVLLRAVIDQAKEEIKEKAAKAEPRAEELKKRIEELGHDANTTEQAAARERIFRVVLELRQQFGIVVTARTDS